MPGATFTQLWGLDDHGVLVGGDDSGGFIDDHGTITVVNQPGTRGFVGAFADGFTTFDLSSDGTFIYGVDNVGEAVGYDDDGAGLAHSFLVSSPAVPEPSSMAWRAPALLVAGARVARRRKTS